MPTRRGFFTTVFGFVAALFVGKQAKADVEGIPLEVARCREQLAQEQSTRHNFVLTEDGRRYCANEGCQAWTYSNGGVGISIGDMNPCPVLEHLPVGFYEVIYTDLLTMLDNIAEHTSKTGDIILSYDGESNGALMFGFQAIPKNLDKPGKGWGITVANLAASLKRMAAMPEPMPGVKARTQFGLPLSNPQAKAEILRHCFKTREGKQRLAAAFPGQRS
jgi:hypothetical protein